MFIVKKLYLKNFMIVEEADFEFDDNQVTAVIGDNGNGKSTIFYAIAYCLSGYRKGDNFGNYIKVGTTSANIVLDALYKDKPIKYDITITKLSATAQRVERVVTYDGQTYVNSEYNTFVKNENLEKLETLMFMFQGNSTLINCRPQERANLLKKIFNSEFPDQVETCKKDIDNTKITVSELNAVLEELKTHTFTNLDILRELSESYIEECKENLTEVSNKITKIGDLEESELERIESDLKSCQKQINDIQTKIDFEEKELSNFTQILKSVEEEVKQYDLDALNKRIEELNKEIEVHNEQYKKDKETYQTLNDKLKLLNYQLTELTSQYEVSKTGVCHACGQPIEQSHIDKLKTDIEETKKVKEQTSKELTDLNFDKKDYAGGVLEGNLEHQLKTIDKYKKNLSEIESLKDKINKAKSSIADRNDFLHMLEIKKEELLKSKSEMSKILPLIRERDALIEQKKQLEQTLNSANETKIKNVERRAANKRTEEEKEKCEKRIEELSLNINTMSVENNRRKVILDIFETQFPNYIIVKMCDRLNAFINSVIQKVFPYCQVKLMPNRSGVSFFYTTNESEEDYLPISMASGAQEKILNLAYLIALSKLSGVSCVFLDEIDASCSPNSAKEIYDFIASLDCFNQLFFISHRDEAVEAVKAKNENLVTYSVTYGKYVKL